MISRIAQLGPRSRGPQRSAPAPLRALVVLVAAVLAVLACPLNARPAHAIEAEFTPVKVRRDILALYDSRHEKKPHETRIHHFAEMPLNFLGLRVVYHDVNTPLPEDLSRYRGLFTWFIEPLADVERYATWLEKAVTGGLRFVFFSELMPPEPPTVEAKSRAILRRLGLEATQQFVTVTTGARVSVLDKEMVGFERPIDKALPDFPVYTAIPGRAKVHLAIDATTRLGRKTAALVTTGEAGGFVSDEFTTYFEPNSDRMQWILNPFAFFKSAFGADRFPVPDVTTHSGRRIYFSHIDGDGWNNISEIERYREQHVSSAEVILREAIEPYPDLPVTVGLIAGDVDPTVGGTQNFASIARRLFALPQVEVGSHTATHPFDWHFYENYDRNAELARIEAIERPVQKLGERIKSAVLGAVGGEAEDQNKRYVAGGNDLPRSYMKKPFDVEQEVKGALAVSESYAPKGKKAKLYMWSGDTTPFEAAVRATREAGVRNINGGDSRLDEQYPSVFYVPPISRPMGKERQIFAVNSNENTYTNDWLGPYYGYFMLEKTLANTEQPRRLKAFNVYYHMYTGEKPGALQALKHHLELARKSDVTPVAASTYAAIADSFFDVELTQVDAQAWEVRNRGALQTVRFDNADELTLDWEKSRGAIGFNRHAGSLYVALDPQVDVALVALERRDAQSEAVTSGAALRLVHSRWMFTGLKREECAVSMAAEGFGPGQMLWQAPPLRGYRLNVSRGDKILATEIVRADAEGRLRLALALNAVEPVEMRFECHE